MAAFTGGAVYLDVDRTRGEVDRLLSIVGDLGAGGNTSVDLRVDDHGVSRASVALATALDVLETLATERIQGLVDELSSRIGYCILADRFDAVVLSDAGPPAAPASGGGTGRPAGSGTRPPTADVPTTAGTAPAEGGAAEPVPQPAPRGSSGPAPASRQGASSEGDAIGGEEGADDLQSVLERITGDPEATRDIVVWILAQILRRIAEALAAANERARPWVPWVVNPVRPPFPFRGCLPDRAQVEARRAAWSSPR
jgi:hypothetical protein